jgi:endonuclease YncB( thermonuclease family)
MYKIKSLEGLELFAKEGVVETERLLTKLKSNLPYSKELKGKVVSIADGDTVIIVVADNSTKSKKQYRIRLNDIDAPESKQAFGNKSKENLKNYIYQKDVVVKYESTDKYGRILGTIYYQGKDINLQQVKDGYAWVYRHYSKKQDYIKEEEKARQERKGLWADKNPINPYDFRRKYK